MVAEASPKVESPLAARLDRPGMPMLWTVEKYLAVVEAGILGPDDKVELLEGEIVRKMGRNPPHIVGLMLLTDALRVVFGTGYRVDAQIPVLAQGSVPEPDVVVLRGSARDFVGRYPGPSDARLVAEVSDSSVAYDRGDKVAIYARAGFAEYWIVNVVDRQLETFRTPLPSGVYGEARVRRVRDGDDRRPRASGRRTPSLAPSLWPRNSRLGYAFRRA